MPNVRSKILLSSSHGYVQKTSRSDDRHFMDPALFKDWDIEASGGRHAQTFLKDLISLENSGKLRQKLAGRKVIVNLHGGNDLSRLDRRLAWIDTDAWEAEIRRISWDIISIHKILLRNADHPDCVYTCTLFPRPKMSKSVQPLYKRINSLLQGKYCIPPKQLIRLDLRLKEKHICKKDETHLNKEGSELLATWLNSARGAAY